MVLLDTHILLWMAYEPHKLSERERLYLQSENRPIFFSAASIWEIALKVSLGKLPGVDNRFREILLDQNLSEIPADSDCTWETKNLPLHHRDPFDRLLIATAKVHSLAIMTRDTAFEKYDISLFQS